MYKYLIAILIKMLSYIGITKTPTSDTNVSPYRFDKTSNQWVQCDQMDTTTPTLTKISPYRFDKTSNQWVQCDEDQIPQVELPKTIRLATHNVLKSVNALFELVINSKKRFAKQYTLLEELDADVIGLNEVTPLYLQGIMELDWVREKYYLSDVTSDNAKFSANGSVYYSGSSMGNLILSKYPIDELCKFSFSNSVGCSRNVIIASLFSEKLVVCSAHITAYVQYQEARKLQLKQLRESLDQSFPDVTNRVIMGDLNLHVDTEDAIITENSYVDLWKSTPEDEHGYTWDTHENKLINWILPFDSRRMRLDRIILSDTSKWKTVDANKSGVIKFATEPVTPNSIQVITMVCTQIWIYLMNETTLQIYI
jgi:endonuclease/exonuclease/phosphatase family metal-dependent hydrolase